MRGKKKYSIPLIFTSIYIIHYYPSLVAKKTIYKKTIYIYIYIYRERERERGKNEREKKV